MSEFKSSGVIIPPKKGRITVQLYSRRNRVPQPVAHKTDQPDTVFDLAHAHILTGKHAPKREQEFQRRGRDTVRAKRALAALPPPKKPSWRAGFAGVKQNISNLSHGEKRYNGNGLKQGPSFSVLLLSCFRTVCRQGVVVKVLLKATPAL